MSSSDRKEYGELEQSMWRRFQDAEAMPSPDVWSRIDHELALQESKHYRGRMVLYRQLAAACFVLFVLAGALLTYHYNSEANLDAGIAAMQLNSDKEQAAGGMAVMEEAAALPLPQELSSSAGDNNTYASDEALNQKDQESAVQESNDVVGRSIAGAYTATKRSGVEKAAANQRAATIGAASGTGKYNLDNAIATASVLSAATEVQNVFNSAQTENNSSKPVGSRFGAGNSFFPTARQAITSVPSSYLNSTEQSIASETGRTRSLVELSQTAVTAYLDKQKKAEELAIALNQPAAGAEKEEKENGGDGRWSLGLGYSPSYFNQNIQMPGQLMSTVNHRSFIAGGPDKNLQTADNMNDARDEFEANTDPAFSFAAEVKTGFNLFKKLKLLAGIGFTQNTARTKSSYIINQYVYKPGTLERVAMPGTTVFLPALNNNFTTDSLGVNKTDEFYVNYRYRHLTLPVGLQYEGKISKDWFWYASGGVAANFLIESAVLASTTEVRDVDYDHNDDSPFRKLQFSGNVSAGFGKRLSNAISVTAGPEFRGYMKSLLAEPDKALAPQGNPYTIGINMSVNYHLGQK